MADYVGGSPSRELGDYKSLVQRRWRWIAAGLAIGLVAALGYLQLATPTYVSVATVRVFQTPNIAASSGAAATPVNLDTEAQVVKSADVAALAQEIAGDAFEGSPSTVELAQRVEVTVPPNSEVLEIEFSAPTAAEAQAGAQAFADAYLADRQAGVEESISSNVSQLESEMAEVGDRLREVVRTLNSRNDPPTASQRAALLARQTSLRSQLNLLQARLQPFLGTVPSSGELNFGAQRPGSPENPKPLLVLPSGLMLGLLLGLGMATVRERTDRRLHSSADVERLFNLRVLAQLNPRKTALAAMRPGERLDHDLRALFHAVEAATADEAHLVLVVNPTLEQPAGEVARALCLVAARTGARTTYLTRMAGSETLLSAAWRRNGNRSELDITNYVDVAAVADGEIRPNALHGVLTQLRQERDFVVLDMPTGDPVIDIPAIARHADVVLVAVELGRTARADLSETLSLLLRSGATDIFAVTIRRGRRAPHPDGDGEGRQTQPDGGVPHPTSGSEPAYQRRASDPRGANRPPTAR